MNFSGRCSHPQIARAVRIRLGDICRDQKVTNKTQLDSRKERCLETSVVDFGRCSKLLLFAKEHQDKAATWLEACDRVSSR